MRAMHSPPETRDLLRALQSPTAQLTGLEALKTRYRPLVCPLAMILEEIPEGARHLDIGCGGGSLMYLAARLRRVALTHGYDVSRAAVETAAALGKSVPDFRVSILDDGELPRLDGYDAVTLVDVIHHIPPAEQESVILRILAGMDDGARLIILDINADRKLRAACNQIHDLLLSHEWVHPASPDRIAGVLRRAGAVVAPVRLKHTLWYSHYLIVASKR